MDIPRPRTFLNLLVVGFIIVSLPLTVGLFSTLSYLDKLTKQSVEIVDYSMVSVKESRLLTENLLNEERHIRLFEIVSSQKHLLKAVDWHKQSVAVLGELQKLPVTGDIRKEMLTMESMQQALLDDLSRLQQEVVAKPETIDILLGKLKEIHAQAKLIGDGVSRWVKVEVDNMGVFVRKARKTLIYQTVGFILLTVFMICVFAVLISWPVKQLSGSVERLGAGDFSSPIFVVGPKDIEVVGEKLEWLRKRLAGLEQEKAKFLAHISHELKTPLASIREGAGLLKEEVVGPLAEKQRRVVSILVNNSNKLQLLIENILKINMEHVGKSEFKNEVIHLRQLIEKVANEQTNKVLSKNLKLEMHLADVMLIGNKKEVEDVFENLFSNAVKFSPIGGVVQCTTELAGKNQIRCLISDEGPGIPASETEKIFSAYYRIGDESHGNEEGTGLGLAIVKEYVENHRGRIEVIRQDEPGGRFQVVLPLDRRNMKDLRQDRKC